VPVGDLVKRGLVFLQLTCVTKCLLCIAVQNVQDTLANTINEFFLHFEMIALRNLGTAFFSTRRV